MTQPPISNQHPELSRHPALEEGFLLVMGRRCLSGLMGCVSPRSQNEMNIGIWYAVQPDYLKAMGIPLLRGRFISPDDNESTPSIVVIDENFAREFFPNENPIGKQINTELMGPLRSEIVGVVGHVKQQGPSDTERQDREGQFYFAVGQMPDKVVAVFTGMTMVARTSATPLASVGSHFGPPPSGSILIRCSSSSNRWTNMPFGVRSQIRDLL